MSAVRMRAVVALLLVLACISVAPAMAFAEKSPELSVPASYLVTSDGHVLWKHHSNTERRVASTIKMLNALVVMDRANLDETVTVPAKAGRTPGVGLLKGQRLTMRHLLQLMLVVSANDAAETLAIRIAGSEKAYVKLMNAKAKQLGLTHTHAIDPHGLSKREHSTAHDLSVIARNVMADPVLAATVRKRTVLFTPRGKPTKKLHSTDSLLGKYAGLVGVKTGFTNPAGYCFVGDATRREVTLVSVVLGARVSSGRFTQTRKLLNWGFAGFKPTVLITTTTTVDAAVVENGVVATVSVHPSREATAMAWTRSPKTLRSIMPTVTAPITRDAPLGVVQVIQDGHALVSVALLADNAVAARPATPTADAEGVGFSGGVWSFLHSIASLPAQAWAAIMGGLHLGRSAEVTSL